MLFSYFLVIFNRYFPCLLVFLSKTKGFVYSFLDTTSYFLICMKFQELMVSGIFKHNLVFHFNETFQILLLMCILMWQYIMQYGWIICSVGLYCCLFCEITKENVKIKPSKTEIFKMHILVWLQQDYENYVSLVTILKMLNLIKISLNKPYLTYQLIRCFSYHFFHIKILLKVAPTNSSHFTKGEGGMS